jgi:PAS domain S-box-containing protein
LETARSLPSWDVANMDSPIYTISVTCLVALVCYQLDRLVFVLGIPPDHIASFWPASAFLVTVLLLVPRRMWPLILAAGLGSLAIADLRNDVPASFEFWISLGNLGEVLVATLGIRRLFKGVPRLSNLKDWAKYLVFAVIVIPSASAFVGSNGSVDGFYWLQWRLWFFADALAFLTVLPAILNWVREGPAWARNPRNFLEFGVLMSLLVLSGYFAFVDTGATESPALLYSLVPFLLWAALRQGLKGVSTSVLVVTFLAILGAAYGRGPFATQGPLNNALSLQLFLFFISIPFMFLAVLVEEQKQSRQALIDEEAQLNEAQRLAQVGSWQCDPRTDSVTWSEELYRIAGRNPNSPAPPYRDHPQLFTPESWERLEGAVEVALRSGKGYELDLEMVRSDGTTRWVIARGEVQRDTAGRIVALCGTAKDITERKRAEEALAGMSGRLIAAQEQERIRIARELHDDFVQRLALLSLEFQQMREDLPESSVELRSGMDELERRTLEISTDIQALSHELHSSKLESLGLVASMRGFCAEFARKHKVQIDFTHESIPPTLPQEISVCLFRVMQEALANAVKHSGGRHFEVRVQGSPREIHLTVRDSGVGFDPESVRNLQGLGIISMRERVNMVKGNFVTTSSPQSGTEVSVRVPLSTGAQTAQANSAAI